MNQEKIGKFISECRRKKKLTQHELGERLGVSDKTVGNWENGRNLPDVSLFKPLCDELDISINELLSGEFLKGDEIASKSEENIINTLKYSKKKDKEKNYIIGVIFLSFGIIITLTAMTIFPSESSWGSLYSVLGCIISLIGFSRFSLLLKYPLRVIANFLYFIIFVMILFIIDYVAVIRLEQPPRFSVSVITRDNVIIYETIFYDVYRVNYGTDNEYYIIDENKEYNFETIPNIPFDRDKTGIDNLINLKSNKFDKELLDMLFNNLPLSNYSYSIEYYDGYLKIYYLVETFNITKEYLQQSLLYNYVSLFLLHDYIDVINFSFNGTDYVVKRESVENYFPNYDLVYNDGIINVENFNIYVEKEVFNKDLMQHVFKVLLIDEVIKDTDKIVVNKGKNKLNVIEKQSIISNIKDFINRATFVTGAVTADGNWYDIEFYKDDKLLISLLGWGSHNNYSFTFGIDSKDYILFGLDGIEFIELIEG